MNSVSPPIVCFSFQGGEFLHETVMSPRLTCVDVTVVTKDFYWLVLTASGESKCHGKLVEVSPLTDYGISPCQSSESSKCAVR